MDSIKEPKQEIDQSQAWEIDIFRPEDAQGVADLFLAVYGTGYPIKKFIDPELLIEENRSKQTVSVVIRMSDGRIVGHLGLYQSAPWERLYEAGAGLVSREFRGGKGLATEMLRFGIDKIQELPVPGIAFGEAVCNHVFMQKISITLNFRPYALEVDLMPAEAYTTEQSSTGRVSTFLVFKTFQKQLNTVFIPPQYQLEVKQLYEGFDDDRDFRLADADWPSGEESLIKTDYFDFAQIARLEVQHAGSDFGAALADIEDNLVKKGAAVIQVWLNLSCPWVGKAVDELCGQSFFLGGVLPRWFDEDGFLMQKIWGKPNWEGIQFASDRGKMVYDLVKADWEQSRRV